MMLDCLHAHGRRAPDDGLRAPRPSEGSFSQWRLGRGLVRTHNPENKPKGFLTYDGNHWTEAGHKHVADQMLKKFK
jgi:hypothetical protein